MKDLNSSAKLSISIIGAKQMTNGTAMKEPRTLYQNLLERGNIDELIKLGENH